MCEQVQLKEIIVSVVVVVDVISFLVTLVLLTLLSCGGAVGRRRSIVTASRRHESAQKETLVLRTDNAYARNSIR